MSLPLGAFDRQPSSSLAAVFPSQPQASQPSLSGPTSSLQQQSQPQQMQMFGPSSGPVAQQQAANGALWGGGAFGGLGGGGGGASGGGGGGSDAFNPFGDHPLLRAFAADRRCGQYCQLCSSDDVVSCKDLIESHVSHCRMVGEWFIPISYAGRNNIVLCKCLLCSKWLFSNHA